jgi:uncharacterized protein (UPF0216 family)
MGTKLNKEAYTKLINENIEELNKHMPENSLEKKHTIEVLKWSVDELYNTDKRKALIDFGLWIHQIAGESDTDKVERLVDAYLKQK